MYRSQLFVPASDGAAVDRALAEAADSVILDLEDTVTHDRKPAARDVAARALNSGSAMPLLVRVNPVDSRFIIDDLATLMRSAGDRLREVWVPKVESAEQVAHVDWLLRYLEDEAGLERGQVRLLLLVETALGVERLASIARSSARVEQLGFGIADLSSDLTLQWPGDGSEQLYVRSRVAVASRSAGLGRPVDSVWPRLDDTAGLAEDCRAAKALGFVGKFALEESQLDVILEVFSPAPAEVRQARELLSSFHEAEQSGAAVVQLPNGEFVDYAFLQRARATLDAAERLGIAGE